MDRTANIAAYVTPFVLFMILTFIESAEVLKPHYPAVYTVKIALVAMTFWLLRGNYPRLQARGVGLGVAYGIVGVIVWIGFCHLNLERFLPEGIRGSRMAYDPFSEFDTAGSRIAFLAVRFFGLALIVPLIEEVFWRGFLLRWLIDEDFEQVPMGTYTLTSFAAVTALFALAHPAEFLAAVAWGGLINVLLYQTKNLWAAVAMHSTTNLLLGIYVLQSGEWHLW